MSDVVGQGVVHGSSKVLSSALQVIPGRVDAIAMWVRYATQEFVHSAVGRWFLSLTLVGPLAFLPTVWEVWTASNIDAFRTNTWPLLTLVNVSVFIAVCHQGDWLMRLTMMAWVVLMALMSIAVWVR